RPASTTSRVTTCRSIMPEPMVLATWVPSTKAATKLKKAAHSTALAGASTRVDTTVEIELAASWNPFRKSNVSATAMMTTRKTKSELKVPGSGVLDQHVGDGVGVVAGGGGGLFPGLVDLLPLHDVHRRAPGRLEEVGDDRVVEGVALVLQLGDAHDALLDLLLVAGVPDEGGEGGDLVHHGREDGGEADERLR